MWITDGGRAACDKTVKEKRVMRRITLAIRIIAAAILLVAAGLTIWVLDDSNAVKGPMLTLIGSAIVLAGLIPARLEWENAIIIAGTVAIVVGSWHWYLDATNGDFWSLLAAIITSAVLVVTPLAVIGIASFVDRKRPDESEDD